MDCTCKRKNWTIIFDGFFKAPRWVREAAEQPPRSLTVLVKAVGNCKSIWKFMEMGENYRLRNIRTNETIPVEALGYSG